MSDQHQAGGAETPSGSQAAGAASPDPEAAPERGSSRSGASAAGSSGSASVASPDAASIEAHLTGRVPSATSGSGTSAPATAKGSKGASGEEGSSAGEASSGADSSEAKKEASAAKGSPEGEAEAGEGGEASEGEGAAGESKGTAETANETEGAGSGTPDTATSEGNARTRRSGRGRGAIATVSGEGRTEGSAATATAGAAAPGGSDPDAAAGFPGRPKKPLLAGAAMAGAVLVAVPLLVMAVSDKDDKSEKVATTGSSDTVLDDDGSRAGAFVPESPSPKKAKPKKEKKAKAPAAKQPPPPAPSSPTAKPKAKPHAPAKKKASNLPLLNNVLIKNNTNQTCADIPGTGYQDGPVHQSVCNSTMQDNQLWDVEKKYGKAGPGGAPLYQIRNVVDNLCMDLPGYGGASGASYVTEYPCNGTTDDNQLWWLDKQADGRYWIRNFASNNQCLDSYEADSDTRNLIIWPCNEESQNNHEWYFTAH